MITEIKLCKSFGNGFRVKNARAIKEDELNKLSYSLSHYILRAKDNDFETVKELTYLQVIQLATPEIEILICDDEEFELIKEIKSEPTPDTVSKIMETLEELVENKDSETYKTSDDLFKDIGIKKESKTKSK